MDKIRYRIETRDGNLVSNRAGCRDFVVCSGIIDMVWIERALSEDCRLKGLELISFTVNKDATIATGIAKWLKTGR